MSKPVLITDPITGRQTYTKHPEKLIERRRARYEAEQLRIITDIQWRMAAYNPSFWNGHPRHKILRKVNPNRVYDPDCGPIIPMHRPGEVRS